MKTMLVATDGSDSSTQALSFAIALARETGARLEVVCVRPRWRSSRVSPDLGVDCYDMSETIAERAAAQARTLGVQSEAHVLDGDTVSSIVEAAGRLGAELLVVGSRGRGSISFAGLGSVSQALVRRSPVPVTVVRQVTALSAA